MALRPRPGPIGTSGTTTRVPACNSSRTTATGITTSAVLKATTFVPSAVPSWGHRADSMVAIPPDPIYGELGVLLDDGERVQCHACGEWYLHLGVHTNAAHGLNADAYRKTFGLMSKTKLGGPAWLAML